MPGATKGIADQHPFGQWRAVMRAVRANGKDVLPASRQQHRFAMSMTEQHRPVRQLRVLDAPGEIGPVELLRCFGQLRDPDIQLHRRCIDAITCPIGAVMLPCAQCAGKREFSPDASMAAPIVRMTAARVPGAARAGEL